MSDPHDEDFLKEITDILDKPEASAPRTSPVTHRRPRRRRRFPWLACGTMLLTGALIFACFRYVQDREGNLPIPQPPPPPWQGKEIP